LAPAAHDYGVAVLEKRALLAALEHERLLTAGGELEQRSRFFGRRSGLRAAAQKIARLEIAPVDGVVRDDLGDAPIRVAKIGSRQSLRRLTGFAHSCGFDRHLQLDIERTYVSK